MADRINFAFSERPCKRYFDNHRKNAVRIQLHCMKRRAVGNHGTPFVCQICAMEKYILKTIKISERGGKAAERPSLRAATYAEKSTQWENSDGMQDAAHVCGRQCGQTRARLTRKAKNTRLREGQKIRSDGNRKKRIRACAETCLPAAAADNRASRRRARRTRQAWDRRSKGLLKRATRITQPFGTPSEWSGKGCADSRKSARRKRQFPYRRSESRLKKQAAEEAKQRAIHFRNVMGTISGSGKYAAMASDGRRSKHVVSCMRAKGDGRKR